MNKPVFDIVERLLNSQEVSIAEFLHYPEYFIVHKYNSADSSSFFVSFSPLLVFTLKKEKPQLLDHLLSLLNNSTPQLKPTRTEDWRNSTDVELIINNFPTKPSSNDLIDLHVLSKKLRSNKLNNLLLKHAPS